MRLLTKTTLYFLIAMVPLLFAAGFFLYRGFSDEMNDRMDAELMSEEIQWLRYLQTEADNGATFVLRTPEIVIAPVNAPLTDFPKIADTYGSTPNDRTLYRQLTHTVPINGISYLIKIRRTQEQKVAMKANVTRIMLVVFAGLFVATLLFTWLISKSLWKPFRLSLKKIREAELQKMEAVRFENSDIVEFNELNASLNVMTDKVYSDYVTMKEFTENAAHEMQTPLAVAQSKMELLLQDTNLTDSQVQAIIDTGTALSRLSKLNQSLLLLAKIENNQYETNELISLTDVTQKYLKLFEEVIKDKQVEIKTNFPGNFQVRLHPLLADSLISNLLGNAVKYNFRGGSISIKVTANEYAISNTSQLPGIEEKQLFKRFNKSKTSSDTSNGLGLAIVKKICDTHQLAITYRVEDNVHAFMVQPKMIDDKRK
ncbi:HAMP domain-containing sensor histidine kinase [Segetibacter sp.]|jgi:signal transduction histidine kinase|uniref:sensor histidine kinase n=1 Tax=Segetibacter sp. TaxID=2231182 RepID=UPI0026250CEE|nr:HAMP domain-containing sensor histidine kinase [Segetibacter sp.]MCW3079811.1 histidine kinase [Segetibacter sp.]